MNGNPSLAERVHETLWSKSLDVLVEAEIDVDAEIRRIIRSIEPLATTDVVAQVSAEVAARIDGLGPLHEFGLDPLVSEIMVNSDGSVWVERSGRIEQTERRLSAESTTQLVRRLAANVGRRIDLTTPAVDVRLTDGSRLHGIIPPLAVDGPCLTIRRFRRTRVSLSELAAPDAAELLIDAVRNRKTIVVAGGTGSGKTTLLNALAETVDHHERIVTIEDAAELQLPGPHVVRLEVRLAGEGVEAIGTRELVRHALRMRPDRIICGEMRGAEALDLVQAMNTGHRGSMTTVHANGSHDVLRRIETMMLLGDADLPLAALRDQLDSSIDLIVMMDRTSGAHRRVVEIVAVPSPEADIHRTGETLYSAGEPR